MSDLFYYLRTTNDKDNFSNKKSLSSETFTKFILEIDLGLDLIILASKAQTSSCLKVRPARVV